MCQVLLSPASFPMLKLHNHFRLWESSLPNIKLYLYMLMFDVTFTPGLCQALCKHLPVMAWYDPHHSCESITILQAYS
jgi:hypothetical protein